jgi:pseudoazurin
MKTTLLATTLLIGSAVSSFAETIEVEMLNQNEAGDRMVFSQELIRAEVGDVIRFIPTDNGHNAQSVKDAVPEGQEDFKGRMNQEVEYTVTEPGLTAVICLPHQVMGMVALIVAGDDVSNADQILEARIPGKGMEKLEALVQKARAVEPAADDADGQDS